MSHNSGHSVILNVCYKKSREPKGVITAYSYVSVGVTCEKAAENGVLSTTPQTRGPRRFKLVLGSCAKLGRF